MSQHPHQQWHDVVAQRSVVWEDGRDGTAVLLVPRFRKGRLARWLMPKLSRPHIRVKLDEIGSFAWKMMDGTTPFTNIVQAMTEQFGPRVQPAEERLMKFMTILYKDQFVRLMSRT
jgi:hypothetical protein